MRKIKDFLYMFAWMLACETITSDIGFTSKELGWAKYLTPVVIGLAYALYFSPLAERRKMEQNKLQN
jgi:hypothetical protein